MKQRQINFWDIFDNFINGNLNDFKRQIKKLSKKELCQFFRFVLEEDAQGEKVIKYLAQYL